MSRLHQLIGGILMVAGTTIGAAMLALPISTGLAGLVPSIVLMFTYWLYMTYTAFLFLELSLAFPHDVNLISIAKHTLGKWGEVASWIVYLFLLYALTTAYIAGSGPIMIDGIKAITGFSLPSWLGPFPLLGIFGWFIYQGTKSVDYANRLLMVGLVVTYCILVAWLMPHVDSSFLKQFNWKYLSIASSIIATSFGFHIIIPTLTSYLNRDEGLLKKVIWIGSGIPLLVYTIWEILALGIIPLEGTSGIIQGYIHGENGAELIAQILENSEVRIVACFFSFFAIVTSFLGVSLSLSDFLADGLNIKKTRTGRAFLFLLAFIPPLAFTLTDPRAFLSALEYAGAFGVVILLGLFPALMVWWARYKKHMAMPYTTPGGKKALIVTMLISLIIILIEIANKTGLISLQG